MKEFIFESQLQLSRPLAEVFAFFADARNLETLTPSWLKFKVLTAVPVEMRPGTLIEYRICIHGLPVAWQTQITEWHPPNRFVDVQLRGPYLMWEHTHSFEEKDGGTLCGDHVCYRPRGGAFVQWLFVRRDIERIFEYRQQRLKEIFAA